jgi:hypothetical protein
MIQKLSARFPGKRIGQCERKAPYLNTVFRHCLGGVYQVFRVCLGNVFRHPRPNRPLPFWTIADMSPKTCHLAGLPVDF